MIFPNQDLKSPTASFVQLVYIRILQDLGFNTNSMLVPSMELMDSLDHPEVLQETVQPIFFPNFHVVIHGVSCYCYVLIHDVLKVFKEMIPTLSLQAGCHHLLSVSGSNSIVSHPLLLPLHCLTISLHLSLLCVSSNWSMRIVLASWICSDQVSRGRRVSSL